MTITATIFFQKSSQNFTKQLQIFIFYPFSNIIHKEVIKHIGYNLYKVNIIYYFELYIFEIIFCLQNGRTA